jgi:signal peptidase I
MNAERLAVWRAVAVRLVQQALVMLSWAVVYLVVVLVVMTALIRVATGWDTVVLSSGSMSPTLSVGDVLFIDGHPDATVGQQTVITFEGANGELITHRVFEANDADGTYVTKGDANPTPDADHVGREQIVGVGWLVIPYLGLPVVWLAQGNLAALFATSIVLLVSLITVALTTRRRTVDSNELDERLSSSAQRGILRVRIVVGLIIAMLIVINWREVGQSGVVASDVVVLFGLLVALGAVTVLARFRATRTTGASSRRLAILELAADTIIVVVFVAASGTSSIGWVLMALPIIEAAVHFRLTGAFIHWIVMSAMSVAALFWTNRLAETSQSEALGSLEQLIDRLGVLLLIVIPTSYLAEQLLGDVLTQHRATRRARKRSEIIERVTDAGLDVARLGVDVYPRLTEAAIDLGFDCADCRVGDGIGEWRVLSQASTTDLQLPEPHDPAGALRLVDLALTDVFVTADDPDEEAAEALGATGFAMIARLTFVHRDGMFVVLRVGGVELADDPASQVMALRLLAAQAAIALQNERLLAELKASHDEIEHRSRIDALTGLPNRSQFSATLSAAINSDPTRVTTMFLDLNGFKAVNDRLGHHVGDELLTVLGGRLQAAVGDHGLVARLGGDEFTVLLADHDPEFGEVLATQIHELVNEPFLIGGEVLHVGTSIGISSGEWGITPSEMMRRADVAMYAAKSRRLPTGTLRYSAELDEADRRTDLLATSLRRAIESDELHLLYQPIVSTGASTIVGVEALVRWVHPELGSVPTEELLDVVEASELVDEFNRWVLSRATSQIAALDLRNGSGGPLPFVAVNVSPAELELAALADNVTAALVGCGMQPDRLVIELSERMIAESPGSIRNVARLGEVGVRLALDDFGEGQTSLTNLRRLPIEFLKLDRVFVMNAGTSEADCTVLRSVVALAHDLGFFVVAEGVEDIDQMTIVTKAGADFIQGFGLYRPMTIDDLADLLANSTPESDRVSFADLEHFVTTPVPAGSLPPPTRDTQRVG